MASHGHTKVLPHLRLCFSYRMSHVLLASVHQLPLESYMLTKPYSAKPLFGLFVWLIALWRAMVMASMDQFALRGA